MGRYRLLAFQSLKNVSQGELFSLHADEVQITLRLDFSAKDQDTLECCVAGGQIFNVHDFWRRDYLVLSS